MNDFLKKLEADNQTEDRKFLFGLDIKDEPFFIPEKKLWIFWTYEYVRGLMIHENLSIAQSTPQKNNPHISWKEAFDLKNPSERNTILIDKAYSMTKSMFVTNSVEHNFRKKEILRILRQIDNGNMSKFLTKKAKKNIHELKLKGKSSFNILEYATAIVMDTMQFLIGEIDKEVYTAAYQVYKYFFTYEKNKFKSIANNQKIIFIVKKLIAKYDEAEDPITPSLWSEMKIHYAKEKIPFDYFIGDVVAVIGAAMESSIAAISSQIKYCFDSKYHFSNCYLDDKKLKLFINEVLLIEPSANYVVRYVKEDLEYKGHCLKKGEKLFLFIPYANKEILNRTKSIPDGKQGCQFGRGRHYCIGSEVALVEIFVALREIINEFKEVDVKLTWKRKSNIKFRNFSELELHY